MRKKDAPQLFEIMRTSLASRVAPPAPKEGPPQAVPPTPSPEPPPAPTPVSPPLIVQPEAESAPPAGPAEAPVAPVPASRPVAAPRPPAAFPHAPPPEPDPAPAPPAAAIAPPPPEPVFTVSPPKPRPRRKPRPFTLKPPAPGLFDAGHEQRMILSYPASLAAAALLFTILFAAFAIGRTMIPARPPDAPPPPPVRPAPKGEVVRLPPRPAAPPWTIRLLEYEVTSSPKARTEAMQKHIEPTRDRLLEIYKADTRIVEWKKGSKQYIGLFYGRWDRPDHPDIPGIEAKLRTLEPFNKGRRPFEDFCKVMQEPSAP